MRSWSRQKSLIYITAIIAKYNFFFKVYSSDARARTHTHSHTHTHTHTTDRDTVIHPTAVRAISTDIICQTIVQHCRTSDLELTTTCRIKLRLSLLSNPDLKLICFLPLSVNYYIYLFCQRLCSRLTALWRYINFVLLLLLLLLPLWPSNLSLDGKELVAASAQSAPSEVLIRFRSRPDIPTRVSWAWGPGGDGTS